MAMYIVRGVSIVPQDHLTPLFLLLIPKRELPTLGGASCMGDVMSRHLDAPNCGGSLYPYIVLTKSILPHFPGEHGHL